MLALKRVYEPAFPTDGRRILVERVWPRGIKEQALALDAWSKDVASTTRLCQWNGSARPLPSS